MKRYCIGDSLGVLSRAALDGVEMIQVRAKALGVRDLMALVRSVLAASRCARVLVSGRLDIALACGAHGVHLPSDSIAPWRLRAASGRELLIGVSCHDIAQVRRAEEEGADFAVFGPVFATRSHPGAMPLGLDALRMAASAVRLPVYALGGVASHNAALCVEAGAAGVAGISLFE